MQTTEFIWFDGKMVPWQDAKVHVLTHALHYGDSVFEGIRAYDCGDKGSSVFRLKEHSQRLVNSAKILRMNIPISINPPLGFKATWFRKCAADSKPGAHPAVRPWPGPTDNGNNGVRPNREAHNKPDATVC